MNKYDYGYEIQTDSTIAWAYSKVEEHSIVLELGPSNGNLAKHLLNEKKCIIDIIEIDEEAGRQAEVYARNSCIGSEEGDLEKFIWAEKLGNQKYDYIIILDVLEHLKNPAKILKRLKNLLQEDGRILTSIPNLAHNSVIIGLLNNQFRYTDVGLLDCTHLKFFTYESVIDMVYSCGFYVDSEEVKHVNVGNNEICNAYEDVPRQVQSYLKTRHLGEAYQFLMVLKKGDKDKKYNLNDDLYEQKQYNFNVFDDDSKLIYSTAINPIEDIEITIPIDSQDVIKSLRIDPLDKNCILSQVVITAKCNGESREYAISQNTGIDLSNKIIFFDDDPQIYVNINSPCSEVKFSCKVLDFDSSNLIQVGELRDYVRKLIKDDSEVYEIILSDKRIIERLQEQNQEFSSLLENSRQEVKLQGEEIQRLNSIFDEKAKEIMDLNRLIQDREGQIVDLKGAVSDRENQIIDLKGFLEERDRELAVIKRHFLYRCWMKLIKLKHRVGKYIRKS